MLKSDNIILNYNINKYILMSKNIIESKEILDI